MAGRRSMFLKPSAQPNLTLALVAQSVSGVSGSYVRRGKSIGLTAPEFKMELLLALGFAPEAAEPFLTKLELKESEL